MASQLCRRWPNKKPALHVGRETSQNTQRLIVSDSEKTVTRTKQNTEKEPTQAALFMGNRAVTRQKIELKIIITRHIYCQWTGQTTYVCNEYTRLHKPALLYYDNCLRNQLCNSKNVS